MEKKDISGKVRVNNASFNGVVNASSVDFKSSIVNNNNINACVVERGVAGFSPTANVVKSGDDVTITITDYKGTTTATIPDMSSDVERIESLIPHTASPTNKLVDSATLNSSVQTATSNFRGDWATYADIPTDVSLYPVDAAGVRTPSTNDYLVVMTDEEKNGGTWRYKYVGLWSVDGKNGWQAEYQVNETPFTADQLAAINSGITSELVEEIGQSGSGLVMFDTILKDHILTYEESQGLALQGTYVYKTAIAGERFGYPDFYNKCFEEYNEATSTETVNGVTVKVHSNGHKFYNIADKTAMDGFFNAMGSAWFYGVDTANERIFLPRNNYFEQVTSDTSKVGDSVEAGLPNITGTFALDINNGEYYGDAGYSGAFTRESAGSQGGSGDGNTSTKVTFNASLSNSIYGNSSTVQPNAVKKLLYICVGNTVSDTSWVDVVTQVEDGVKDLEYKTLEGIERLRQSSTALTQTQITNCLLEVPQRIKYTLEDGTLTIKAGSVVIVPYGTEDLTAQYPKGATFLNDNFKVYDTQFADGKFFVWAEVQNDISLKTSVSDTNVRPVLVTLTKNSLNAIVNNTSSNTQFTGTGNNNNYRTDLNLIENTSSGALTSNLHSFPVLMVQADGINVYGSIKQVFNGMGYIGSTVWVDKGVKGLIPNGRNEDGSLNNIEIINQTLDTYTYTWGDRGFSIFLTESGGINWCGANDLYRVETFSNLPTVSSGSIGYVDNDNQWYIATKGSNFVWKQFTALNIIKAVANNSIITSFNPKQPFRALDYSDKSQISGWGMPSNKYIDLTLGASGTEYTAPANGYFAIHTDNIYCFRLYNNTKNYGITSYGKNGFAGDNILFVNKGDVVKVIYEGASSSSKLKFIYAQGEN